jgi:hypothetical protein
MSGTPADDAAIQAGQAPAADPATAEPVAPPPRPSRTRWFVLGFLIAGGAAASAAVAIWPRRPPPPPGPQWQLVVDERFDRPAALTAGWRQVQVPDYAAVRPMPDGQSSWRVEDGALIGEDRQGRVANIARTDLPAGALRASWRLTPQLSPLNLNCFVGAPNRLDGYTIHVGGWGRPDYVAVGRGAAILDACTLAEPLRIGRTYEFAVEFDQGVLGFSIDGFRLLSCRDPEPLPGSESGGLGFEVNWNTLRIDDLRIEVLPQPREPSPLAAADALASAGAHARAAAAYRGFIRSWPDDPLVPAARMRLAGALLRSGFATEGRAMLAELRSSPDQRLASLARFELLRDAAATAEAEALDLLMADLAQARPDPTLSRLALSLAGQALLVRQPDMDAAQVLSLVARIRRWSSDLSAGRVDELLVRCADRLNQLGRHEDVLAQVPEPAVPSISALLALGRYDEVHRRYPGIQWARYAAFSDTARHAEGVAALSEPFLRGRLAREGGAVAGDPVIASAFDRAYAQAQAEGGAPALLAHPEEVDAIAFALLELGRAEEALAVPGIAAATRGLALLQLGRLDEAETVLPADARSRTELAACRAIAAGTRLATPARWTWGYESRWSCHAYDPCFSHHFAAFVLPALLAWQTEGGDPRPAWRELAAVQQQLCSLRVDHRWRGLLSAAGVGEVLTQPFRSAGHPAREAALIAAIRADLAGEAGAAGAWRAYLAIASPFDAAARAWARQRLARLAP